jgi:hypothetical protein
VRSDSRRQRTKCAASLVRIAAAVDRDSVGFNGTRARGTDETQERLARSALKTRGGYVNKNLTDRSHSPSVAGSAAHVALQQRLGILPKRRAGFGSSRTDRAPAPWKNLGLAP